MQVVDKFADEFSSIVLFKCDDPDASDHLHFEFKIDYHGYQEQFVGVIYLDEDDKPGDIAEKFDRLYRANAKKLYCQQYETNEITIH